jgi:hypothetical protein
VEVVVTVNYFFLIIYYKYWSKGKNLSSMSEVVSLALRQNLMRCVVCRAAGSHGR